MTPEAVERHRLLELACEVDVALDALWASGQVAVALRLLLEDCQRLLSVSGAPPAELEELCRHATLLGTPPLERELTPAHRELLGRLARSRRRALARLRHESFRWRAAWPLAVVALFGVGAYLTFRNVPTAHASGIYSSDFPASQATDGLSTTDWLLPQQQTGWLELTFARSRTVRAVVLRNAVNGHFRDRATKAFNVEARSRGQVVARAQGQFPSIEAGPGPLTVRLDAANVTELRISVESFYGNGGGLAEVGVE